MQRVPHRHSRILAGIRHKTAGAAPHGGRGKSRMVPQGAGGKEQDNPAALLAGRNLSVPSRVIYNIYCIFIIIAPAHGIYSCTHNPERERTRDRKILKYFYRVFVPVGSLPAGDRDCKRGRLEFFPDVLAAPRRRCRRGSGLWEPRPHGGCRAGAAGQSPLLARLWVLAGDSPLSQQRGGSSGPSDLPVGRWGRGL